MAPARRSAAANCWSSPACCPRWCTPRCSRRAIRTAEISLHAADRHWIETKRSWRLNERHYGALQGKDKAATLAEYGEEQFMTLRRSYDTPPPPIDKDNEFANFHDPRYAGLPTEARPVALVPQGRVAAGAAVLVRPDRP